MRISRVLAAIVSFSALVGFASTASAQELPSGVLKMADGKYYQPSSGVISADLNPFLFPASASSSLPTASTSTVPSVPPGTVTSTPPVVQMFPLKLAITRGRQMLQDAIDADGSGKIRIEKTEAVWRDVTIAVWNPKTDAIRTIDMAKNGTKIKGTDDGVEDVTVTRANGLNSEFRIDSKDGEVVVAIRYPISTEKAITKKKKVYEVRDVVYTPYSSALHTPEMVAEGKRWLDATVAKVYGDLRTMGVTSRAFKGKLVSDTLDPEFVKAIVLIEHTDENALAKNAQFQIDALYVTFAANEGTTFNYSRSAVGALGLVQFMSKTYAAVAKWTPYKLNPSFEPAMRDPENAIRAEVAYLDYLLSCFSDETVATYATNRDLVHEYVAAAYNGGVTRAYKASVVWEENMDLKERIHVLKRSRLKLETMKYVLKLRMVRKATVPPLQSI